MKRRKEEGEKRGARWALLLVVEVRMALMGRDEMVEWPQIIAYVALLYYYYFLLILL